jgi:tellurite resistance protein TehA-like permease
MLHFARGEPEELRTLHPAYFALVMATGIVALDLALQGLARPAALLLWLNLGFFAILAVLTVVRAVRYPGAFRDDIASHSRGVGFFTTVAATSVLGIQLLVQSEARVAAALLWIVAAVLLVLVTYGVLGALTVKEHKPTLEQGLNGGWLVSVVAAQSVAILTVLLAAKVLSAHAPLLVFAALVLWLGGGALYLWLTTLIVLRYTFGRMAPDDMAPPYWINMGAVAISTLAGTVLLQHLARAPALVDLAPFLKGFTLFFWAIGTWWIPMLLVLGAWRYLWRGFPLRYDPLYWGAVFPLGMYSVCTHHLARVLHLPFLLPLSRVFFYAAVAAWLLTFVGLADSLVWRLRVRGVPAQD